MGGSEFEALRKSFSRSRGMAAVRSLLLKEFDARYFDTVAEVKAAVMEVIPPGSRIGAGGSVTLREIGILEDLSRRGDMTVFHAPEMEPEESMRVRKEAMACPYFLCSANAITMEGEIVNTDGIGNRITGTIFGPHTVVIIAGINKVVADLGEAFSRIRNVAAPANARRLGIDVPCVEKGKCVNCASSISICRVTAIMHARPILTDVKVFLVGTSLGF